MPITEANIRITRENNKVTSVSVLMPVWNKTSEQGNHLIVNLPFIGMQTVAKDEADADKAIDEAIALFCVASEKFGQGIEKELQALGWIPVDSDNGEPLLGFTVDNTDALLERLIQTGDTYINKHLEIA